MCGVSIIFANIIIISFILFLKTHKNHIFLHLIVFIWGFTAILGRLIHLSAPILVGYRMGLSVVGIGLYAIFFRKNLLVTQKHFWALAGIGLLVTGHWVCFFGAIKASNVSVTLAVLSVTTFFTALIEPIFYKRKIARYELLLGGLVVLAIGLIFRFEPQYKLGIFLAAAAALLAALFSVLNGLLINKVNAVAISFYEMLAGFVGINLYLAYSHTAWAMPNTLDWVYLLVLAWVCTAFAFVASVDLLKKITPYSIALATNLEPIYGILMAYFLFPATETMGMNFYLGAVFIVFLVIFNGVLKAQKP